MSVFNEYKSLFKIYITNGSVSRQFNGAEKHLKLNPHRQYVVGIDQATIKTGMFIKSVNDPVGAVSSQFLLDIENGGLPNKETYFIMFKSFLTQIFEGIRVNEVYIEVPIETSPNIYTRSRLEELKGMINTLQLEIPSFRDAEFISVPPNIWRKHYLKDKCYDGRRRDRDVVKVATEEEGLKRYPQFEEYTKFWSKPQDSFDAMGIAEGGAEEVYFDKSHTIKRINSLMRATKKRYEYRYEVIPKNMEDDELNELIADLIYDMADLEDQDKAFDIIENRGLQMFVCDDIKNEEEFHNIISKAVSSTSSIVLIVYSLKKRKEDLLKWVCDIDKADDECYICVCYANNYDNKVKTFDKKTSWASLSDIFDLDYTDEFTDIWEE